jgi:hypothetical protein
LANGSRFCGACGKALSAAGVIQFESRLSRHLRLLGILWLAAGALNFLGAFAAWFAGDVILPMLLGRGLPAFIPLLVKGAAFFMFVKAAACAAAGWGLLERESWARLLTLVLAFVSLFNPVLGTALGIYTLWVLLPRQSQEEYQRMAQAA